MTNLLSIIAHIIFENQPF
nr:unnamed protein product [Callosobruchus chinensis]